MYTMRGVLPDFAVKETTEGIVIKRWMAWALAALLIFSSAMAWAEEERAEILTNLKLRKEPSTAGKVLDTYKKGTPVTILEIDGDWCKVEIGGRTGYMMREYISIPESAMPEERESAAEHLAAADECLCDEAYLLDEGQEPVITNASYQSANVFIDITSTREGNTDVFVADIRIRSLASLQRVMANKWKNGTAKIAKIAKDHQAILAMTSDSAENLDAGWVIMNGETLRKTKNRKRDLCVLYVDGAMEVIPAEQLDHDAIAKQAQNGEIWQTFLFGPTLLDAEGKRMTEFNSTVGIQNPRSVIGYYEPGHYCFVQVDGRKTPSKVEPGKKNRGLTLTELSAFMEELGCTAAYNLDGGQSSVMFFSDGIYSNPQSGGRRLGDAVIICEP